MTASVSLDSRDHSWRATARGDMSAVFRRARRHSRLVRMLRIALPGAIGAIVALNVLSTYYNPFSAFAGLPSLAKLGISGSRITMDTPRLAGYMRDGRAYELTASAAAQDLKRPQFIELEGIRAKVDLPGGDLVTISASGGVYDTKTETVRLQRDVIVTTAGGTEVRMIEVVLDMRKGHANSEKPVEVVTKSGNVKADQMEVIDNGAVIHFRGNVRMDVIDHSVAQVNQAGPIQ